MRRSRISIKPNFKPGNRMGIEPGKEASQPVDMACDTLKTEPTQSQEQNVSHVTCQELSEDVCLKETPEMPSQVNQNNGAPSSGTANSSTAPYRRMRISAAPKLVRPKLSSMPRSQTSAQMSSSTPSALPNEHNVQIHDSASEAVSGNSNSLPEPGTPIKSTSTTGSSSPCVPSTSGLQNSLVPKKSAVEDSPPSPLPGQVPQQALQDPDQSECLSASAGIKSSFIHSDKAGSPERSDASSDKVRILRALKLKELMKIERRKDIQKEKRKVGHKTYTAVDRSKMTMRELLYYLPNTSPMRSSVVCEENPQETIIPPSPKEQIKTAEKDEEDEEAEEEEEESDHEETLMPKVRVAEDGSIVLDEESLTVRVQRSSNTKIVENSSTLFERGSTTTYTSFRKLNHVKCWSVRETDLFFLAISMVGTDFSLVGQLLTHRSRAAIKSKFKKEERANPWRVDKAMRNARPYDKEFFSYLLEKVLAKDKGKSIKLVLPKTSKPRRSKGKTSNKRFGSENEEEEDDLLFHKSDEELEDHGDVSQAKNKPGTVRKRCKRKDKDGSSEEPVKRKRQRKGSNKTKEVCSKEDSEGECDRNDDGDCVNKEDELKRSTSASKRRRKRSTCDEEKQTEKPVKGTKGKRTKESLKVVCDPEESVSRHEESSIADDEGPATKRKRGKNIASSPSKSVTKKKNPKSKKALKSTVEEEATAEGAEALANLQDVEQVNTLVTDETGNNVSPKATRRNKKPKLAGKRSKKRKVLEGESESEDEDNHKSILTVGTDGYPAAGSPLEDERLQMQAVVELEKTPPRQQYLPSPPNVKCKNNELDPSMSSPSSSDSFSTQQTRMRRAGRVKRDLSSSQKTRRPKRSTDPAEPVSENPTSLLESITQESVNEEEDDDSLNENLVDLSCLRDLDSPVCERRPMVVLSREEVDMILNASEQSAEEDPSVSPLDLSLNTELSFSLHCSRLLEDNDEEDVVDCTLEENEGASCEPKNCQELMLTQSASAQPDVFDLSYSSTTLKPEVCSQAEVDLSEVSILCSTEEAEPKLHPAAPEDVTMEAEVFEASSPLVLQEHVDPICMKLDSPVTQETVTTEATTLGNPSMVSDVMEESEKADMQPSLHKEKSGLTSSEIRVQSKLSPVGSGLGSQRSLKAELQTSPKEPSQTLDTLQDLSETKKDAQESTMGSGEIKVRTQSGDVGLEVAENSQEQVSVRFSGESISHEHGTRATRRSRILKPRPNLSQKTRATVLHNQKQQQLETPSALKPKSCEPSGSNETVHSTPVNDQHCENFSEQNLTKEVKTSCSDATNQIETKSTDLSNASTSVPAQENITTVTPNPSSAAEPQEVSASCRSMYDVDIRPPCTSTTSQQPLQDITDTGSGQMNVPFEDVCAPAKMVHLIEDDHNDEEPTFILTLYEIPVTEAYLPSSSNDPAMISDLPEVEPQASLGFSDQADSLPSPSRIDLLQSQNDFGIVMKDLSENDNEKNSKCVTSHESILLDTTDNKGDAIGNLETGISDCDMDSDVAPPEDLTSHAQRTSSGPSMAKCITLHQDSEDKDTEQRETVSHMLLGDIFVPVSEETVDDRSKVETLNVNYKLESSEASTVNVTEDLAENAKEQISEDVTSHKPIVLDKKHKEGGCCVNLEPSIPLYLDSESECKNGSEFAPAELKEDLSKDRKMVVERKLESSDACTVNVAEDSADNVMEQISKDLTSQETIILDTNEEESDACVNVNPNIPHWDPCSDCKNGSEVAPLENVSSSTPSRFSISKCITLHQDSEDTEQCDRVSHVLLGDFFVPVSEELEDDLYRTRVIECKKDSIVSLPERPDAPVEELTTVENLPTMSNALLCSDSTEESQCPTPLSERTKSPAKRRVRQKIKPQPKLLQRARGKADSSKTDVVVKVPKEPTTSQILFPASNVHKGLSAEDDNLPGISTAVTTTTETAEKKMLSLRGNKTSASRGQRAKTKSIAEKCPKKSRRDLGAMSTSLHLSKEHKLDNENSKNVMGDTTASAEDKQLSVANVQTCCEAMHFNLLESSGSGSSTVETETETQAVSHLVLPEVSVLVSDVMKDILSSPQRVSLLEKAGSHFEKELKTEDASKTFTKALTPGQSPLKETKTPVRTRAGKQEFGKKPKPSQQSPQTSTQSAHLPQTDHMLLLEEKLRKQHHIMPSTVTLSSLDTVEQSLNVFQPGDGSSNAKSKGMSPSTPSLLEEVTMEDPESGKKSPARRKGKQTESSPNTKRGLVKPVQSVCQTRQLTITDWVKKKSRKSATNQQEKQSVQSPQKQSSLKDQDLPQLMAEKTCSKTDPHPDLEKPEGSHLPPTLEKTKELNKVSTEVEKLSEMVQESTEDQSVSRLKKSPAKRRAKLQVKPTLSIRARTKGNTSTTVQQRPTGFTSPTRQHARAAREKEESDNKPNQPGIEDTNPSSIKASLRGKESPLMTSGPLSPKSQDVWPKVVLPRINLETTEAGICSASATLKSSPARVSQSASPPMTPLQMKKSPTQSSSPAAKESPNADPSRVSQFFFSDIFTEVAETE